MNEAVEEIRNKVQDVFNSGQMFTREDRQFDQYEICCESSGLTENPNFPNVSKIAGAIALLGVLMINLIQVHRVSSNSLFSSSLNDNNGFHATFVCLLGVFPLFLGNSHVFTNSFFFTFLNCIELFFISCKLTVNTEDMCAVGPTSGLTYRETKYPVKDAIREVH